MHIKINIKKHCDALKERYCFLLKWPFWLLAICFLMGLGIALHSNAYMTFYCDATSQRCTYIEKNLFNVITEEWSIPTKEIRNATVVLKPKQYAYNVILATSSRGPFLIKQFDYASSAHPAEDAANQYSGRFNQFLARPQASFQDIRDLRRPWITRAIIALLGFMVALAFVIKKTNLQIH